MGDSMVSETVDCWENMKENQRADQKVQRVVGQKDLMKVCQKVD